MPPRKKKASFQSSYATYCLISQRLYEAIIKHLKNAHDGQEDLMELQRDNARDDSDGVDLPPSPPSRFEEDDDGSHAPPPAAVPPKPLGVEGSREAAVASEAPSEAPRMDIGPPLDIPPPTPPPPPPAAGEEAWGVVCPGEDRCPFSGPRSGPRWRRRPHENPLRPAAWGEPRPAAARASRRRLPRIEKEAKEASPPRRCHPARCRVAIPSNPLGRRGRFSDVL